MDKRSDAGHERARAPLSFAQQRLWFLDRLAPGSALYNVPIALELNGPLDVAALEQALDTLVERHASLRTVFPAPGGEPFQELRSAPPLSLPLEDLSNLSEPDRSVSLDRRIVTESGRPFELADEPPIRFFLIRLGAASHVLIFVTHHIVFDAWSAGIFLRELAALYEARCAGQPSPLAVLPIQYADFTREQRERLSDEALQTQLAFWKQRLKPPLPVLELAADRPRPAARSDRGHRAHLTLPDSLINRIEAIGQRENATLFLMLLTAYAVLLHRHGGQEDIVIGTPVANRTRPQVEPLIGFFANTLPLRVDLTGEPTFRALIARTKQIVFDAYNHQEVPFESLVESVNPERTLRHTPIVQTLLVLNNPAYATRDRIVAGGLTIKRRHADTGTSKFDLSLLISPAAVGWQATLESSADLFDEATGARMLRRFERLLEAVADDPDCAIGRLTLLPEAERWQVVAGWNATSLPTRRETTLAALFEQQVARTPDADAVVCGSERVSYAALNSRANRLAAQLRRLGVGPDSRVAIFLDRTPALVASVLAVVKAGGAYVPLDKAYPFERLRFILTDAGATVLITHSSLAAQLPSGPWRTVCVDDVPSDGAGLEENPVPVAGPNHLAYVIYTSGSTGTPKGVALEQQCLVNLVSWALGVFAPEELSGMLAATSIGFDVSAFELFVPLSAGGAVVLVDNLLMLPSAARTARVTFVNAVPSVMVELLRFDTLPASVKVVALAGEPLDQDLVDRIYRSSSVAKVFDLYGPTETHIATSALRVPNGPTTIGRPIANMQALVLDRFGEPTPIGVPGELYLSGEGVARGYINRIDLTNERFLPSPFDCRPGQRMYRTGDRASWRPDGTLEFLGRVDRQVKIRGFRIELDEIETVLRAHRSIDEATVITCNDRPDVAGGVSEEARRLVAYVVASDTVSSGDLQGHLESLLPAYMIPAEFVRLDRLPKLPNGKIDRARLPSPFEQASPAAVPDRREPATPAEEALTRLWAEVLGRPSVGVDDNFFHLGGHSLLAIRLFVQIEKQFGVQLPLSSLFESGTVRAQARLLTEGPDELWSPLVAIQPRGGRPPFFLVHGIGGELLSFEALARHVPSDQPLYGLRPDMRAGAKFFSSVEDVADLYLRHLRERAPSGPYLLGGYSSGGVIAYEMAQRLYAAGQVVSALVMLDSPVPGAGRREVLMPAVLVRMVRNALFWLIDDDFLRSSRHDQVARVRAKVRAVYGRALARAGKRDVIVDVRDALGLWQMPDDVSQTLAAHIQMVDAYRIGPYPGRVTVLKARTSRLMSRATPDLGWKAFARGGVIVREVPGAHDTILIEPRVRALGAALDAILDEAVSAERSSRSEVLDGVGVV